MRHLWIWLILVVLFDSTACLAFRVVLQPASVTAVIVTSTPTPLPEACTAIVQARAKVRNAADLQAVEDAAWTCAPWCRSVSDAQIHADEPVGVSACADNELTHPRR